MRTTAPSTNEISGAEQAFGREHVEQRKRFRQRKCRHGDVTGPPIRAERESSMGDLAKVHVALRRLGFGDAEARRAVAEVEKLDESALTLEEMLRYALLSATRAA